jgi:ATP-dependent Clp protease adaptor protein ClpS
MVPKDQIRENSELEEFIDQDLGKKKSLILHNDDFHTFDFVIDALVEVCDHQLEQAEQCTYLVHYKGKCDVKRGSLKKLKPLRSSLADRGLKATID